MIITFLGIDLEKIFAPSIPVFEIIVRGSAIYLALFFLLRVILKREKGTLSASDLLVVVLLADAVQNAMAGSYESVTDGLILVITILFWSYSVDWLGYNVPWFQRLTTSRPLPLVEDGKILWHNMRKELVTREELMEQIREQGLEDLSDVRQAFMESDGRISIIGAAGSENPRPPESGKAP